MIMTESRPATGGTEAAHYYETLIQRGSCNLIHFCFLCFMLCVCGCFFLVVMAIRRCMYKAKKGYNKLSLNIILLYTPRQTLINTYSLAIY